MDKVMVRLERGKTERLTTDLTTEIELRTELQIKPLFLQLIPVLEELKDTLSWNTEREMVKDITNPINKMGLEYKLGTLHGLLSELTESNIELFKEVDKILKYIEEREGEK